MTEIVQTAQTSGIKFEGIQVIDSVNSEENVNSAKDKRRQNDEKGRMIRRLKEVLLKSASLNGNTRQSPKCSRRWPDEILLLI